MGRSFSPVPSERATGFETSLLSATEIQAPMSAWQSGAIMHNLRTGEILPSPRTNEQEQELNRNEPSRRLLLQWRIRLGQ